VSARNYAPYPVRPDTVSGQLVERCLAYVTLLARRLYGREFRVSRGLMLTS
jgi:hypothetical protein